MNTGQLIAGHYRLVEHIGSGAMGVVWRAVDERLERSVAIKQILAQPGLSEAERHNIRQRAMREAKNAARLQHPHAIVVFDIAEYDGDPCLVMEYLPSRSLSAILAQQPTLSLGHVAKIGEQVASALVAAHRAGIVHRDVKPGNILIDDNGVTKITDFGISRATGDMTLTQTGLIGGTPAYLAPEIARGADPGPASDVFALGATLYHSLEGQPPYGNNTNQLALLYAAANGQITPPQRAGKATALLMNLLRAEPAERPSMAETQARLAELAQGAPAPTATLVAPAVLSSSSPHAAPALSPSDPPPWRREASANAPQQTPIALASPPGPETRIAEPARKPSAQQPKNKRNIVWAGIGAGLLAVVLVVVMVLNSTSKNDTTDDAQPPTPTNTSSAPPAGLGETPTSGKIEFSPAGNRVVDFYELPAKLAESWNMLTPAAQQIYGNQQAFNQYWGQYKFISSKEASGKLNSDSSVNITLTVDYGDKTEKKTVRVINSGGVLLIDSDTR